MLRIHPPGTRLGKFEVVNHSIPNDVCIDYICLDRQAAHPVVLKTLRPELGSHQLVRERFAQLGAAWVNLGTHPHIVRCHEVLVTQSPDEIFLVLQAVIPGDEYDTPTLISWLQPGQPLPVLQSLLFAVQIARGMRLVTSKIPGFVYDDLTPENVMVGKGRLSQADVNRLRITNIGLSSLWQIPEIGLDELLKIEETSIAQTQSINGVVGTPLYMSPEQWRGESLSTATAMYAFGCLLYKMLVGRHPVAGNTTTAMRDAHCSGKLLPLPASLPEAVQDLTAGCLALQPDERYQSWDEVESAIAAAYQDLVQYSIPLAEKADSPTPSERKLEGWFLNSLGCISLDAGNSDTAVACFEMALKKGNAENDRGLVGTVTSNVGEVYRIRGETQRAIEQHQKALSIAYKIPVPSVEGAALNGLGVDHLQLGNPRQAILHFDEALRLAREIDDRQGEMAALANLGSAYQQLGEFQLSIQYYEKLLKLSREAGNRRSESVALTNLGGIHSTLSDYDRAIEYQELALKIKAEIGDRHGQIASFNNLANAYRDQGKARQALDNYNKSLEIALEMGDRRGEAFALNNIGSTYSNLGSMEPALKHHEEALAIFREIGDRRSQGDCLTNMGLIYRNRGEIKLAKESCEQAMVIDREIGDMFGLALDSFNMANILAEQNLFHDALPYAEETARIMEKVGHTDKASEARQLVSMIRAEIDHPTSKSHSTETQSDLSQQILQFRQDNLTMAAKMSDEEIMKLFQQADQAIANDRPTVFVTQKPQDKQGTQPATITQNFEKRSMDELIVQGQQLAYGGHWQDAGLAFEVLLKKARQAHHNSYQSLAFLFQGRLHNDQGNYQRALDLFHQSLDLAKLTNDLKLVAQIYDGMGIALDGQGKFKDAITQHTLAIEIAQRLGDEAGSLISKANLGNVYRRQGNLEQAVTVYKDMLEYAIRKGAEQMAAQAYCNLGLVYQQQGLRDLAVDMEQKSLEIASRLGDQLTVAIACTNLGLLRTEQGDYTEAVRMVRQALQINEQFGRVPEIAKGYSDLASLYKKLDDLMNAFMSYDRALVFYNQLGKLDDVAKIHFNMGNLYRQQGKTVQAHEQFKEAQRVFESIGKLENAEQAAQQFRL